MTAIPEGRLGLDIVTVGGHLVDGSGRPSRPGDVGIRGDRIVAIGNLDEATATIRLDASGCIVAPGFIDIHSHSDVSLLVDPAAESALLQGVTTEVVGNCGHGAAPMRDRPEFRQNLYGMPSVLEIDWTDMAGYLGRLAAAHTAINVASLVANGNLRLAVLGPSARPASAPERDAMVRLLEAGLAEGAIGLSTGLEYPLEQPTSQAELVALCRVVAARDGLHATHTRDRDAGVMAAVGEAVSVAQASGVRLEVAHTVPRRGALDRTVGRLVELLEDASSATDLAWDTHTRTFAMASLASILPPELAGLPASVSPAARQALARRAVTSRGLLGSFARAGWDRVRIVEARQSPMSDGASVAEMMASSGSAEPVELLIEILLAEGADGGRPMVIADVYDEEDIATLARSSRCLVASDGATMSPGGPYPRAVLHGSFSWVAWYLRRLVRERRDLELVEAVRRLTSLAARQAGLAGRGLLEPGAAADVVVLDSATVREQATVDDSTRPAIGVRHVLVNGVTAVRDGVPTGLRPGRVLVA